MHRHRLRHNAQTKNNTNPVAFRIQNVLSSDFASKPAHSLHLLGNNRTKFHSSLLVRATKRSVAILRCKQFAAVVYGTYTWSFAFDGEYVWKVMTSLHMDQSENRFIQKYASPFYHHHRTNACSSVSTYVPSRNSAIWACVCARARSDPF